eukprot:364682-Chlamydomonas_euryale.AAC.27
MRSSNSPGMNAPAMSIPMSSAITEQPASTSGSERQSCNVKGERVGRQASRHEQGSCSNNFRGVGYPKAGNNFHIFCCQITIIAKNTINQAQTWINKKRHVDTGTAERRRRGKQAAASAPTRRPTSLPGVFHAAWCVPCGLVCSTLPGVFHAAWCVPRCLVCSMRPGVFHAAWCVPCGLVCSTRPGVFHAAWCVPRGLLPRHAPSIGAWRAQRPCICANSYNLHVGQLLQHTRGLARTCAPGTSPAAMRSARPSTSDVLPTPGSPRMTGLFLVRRDRMLRTLGIMRTTRQALVNKDRPLMARACKR